MAQRLISDWYMPFFMVATLTSGVLLAFGHHTFYKSLDGKPTSGHNRWGYQNRGQQFNTSIGTAFAFTVKSTLVISVTSAYYQLFWKVMKQASKTQNPATLGWLDAAFSGTNNIVSLLKLPIWFRFPFLLAMALSVWYVDLYSVNFAG